MFRFSIAINFSQENSFVRPPSFAKEFIFLIQKTRTRILHKKKQEK